MGAIFVNAETLPEAWEQAVLKTWEQGDKIKTDYDKPEDPESRDTSCLIVVKNPFAEPRIHKAFPGGLNDLWKYREEVVHGVRDHWINPEEGKWSYTYHGRLTAFPLVRVFGPDGKEKDPENDLIDPETDTFRVDKINQLEGVLSDLERQSYSRRAIGGLWRPGFDIHHDDPPCLDLVQFRVFQGNKLNMHILIRSNDAFKAAFMNMYAFTELQKEMAKRLSEKRGEEIVPGEYRHLGFSFHIYGSYFNEFEGFLKLVEKRPDRYFYTDDPVVQGCFNDGRVELLQDTELPRKHRIRIYRELPHDLQEKHRDLAA